MNSSSQTTATEPLALHELMSRILVAHPSRSQGISRLLPTAGTLQSWNQKLVQNSVADFCNSALRGVGQVIFVNNPISGALILLALFVQSAWVGWMGLLGVVASTTAAKLLKLDAPTTRNGIFGYNGLLVGAALATFSNPISGLDYGSWAIAVILFASLTTLLMKTFGVWWAKTVHTPPLTLPFNIATLICLALVAWIPQPWLQLGAAAEPSSLDVLQWGQIGASLPLGFGQVFLADSWIAGLLILLAVAVCTPLGAAVGLLGGVANILAGVLIGAPVDTLYAGLWAYNGVLCAMAIGGVFYAPTLKSIGIGAIAAFISGLVGGGLGLVFSAVGLPVLTVPFCLVTIGCFVLLQHSLPSLVPVALHAVASPEEHRQRYLAARQIITTFRRQLGLAIGGTRQLYCLERATDSVKGDLRYLFNRIDEDGSGSLSTEELAMHLGQSGQTLSETELSYLMDCMDIDNSGTVDFEEFGELMLRHRRLMANYTEFVTYFLPIDADDDDAISLTEMNVAMASVGKPPLSTPEADFIKSQTGHRVLTWNRFIELLLVT